MSPEGRPLEDFLIDPPQPLPHQLPLARQGVLLVERDGCRHVVDWVGVNHYPNVADFLEEARRYGVSRRIPRSAQFEFLQPGARLLLVHARAIPRSIAAYRRRIEPENESARWSCPQGKEEHQLGATLCAGVWWEDVDPAAVRLYSIRGAPDTAPSELLPRWGTRTIPSCTYDCHARPVDVLPLWLPGFIASFPITRLAVIRDPEQEVRTTAALEAARRSGLLVSLEEE